MENRENDMEKAGSSPLLEVEHLEVSFLQYERGWSQKTIVPIRDLSLSVHSGEMVAVVGSSGSGKSLLAHAVMGLLPYNGSWKGADGKAFEKAEGQGDCAGSPECVLPGSSDEGGRAGEKGEKRFRKP